MVRPAQVRFYIDADLLGLAKLLCSIRSDFTYPGDPGAIIKRRERPPCIITSAAAKDPTWIAQVAAEGWLIVTRDRHIQQRLGEINAVRDYGAKMINLASDDARDPWGQLEVFMTRWREIERVAGEPGSFIYVVSRRGRLRQIDL
jgi:hypothetical protein